MDEQQLKALEQKIDQLVRLCEQLKDENKALKVRESGWHSERSRLVERNEHAKLKVEAMITRLRALEQHS
jgi:cell division protein ZapB